MQMILLRLQAGGARRTLGGTGVADEADFQTQESSRAKPPVLKNASLYSEPNPVPSRRAPSFSSTPGFSSPGSPNRISFICCDLSSNYPQRLGVSGIQGTFPENLTDL